jgi:hypothetical protein
MIFAYGQETATCLTLTAEDLGRCRRRAARRHLDRVGHATLDAKETLRRRWEAQRPRSPLRNLQAGSGQAAWRSGPSLSVREAPSGNSAPRCRRHVPGPRLQGRPLLAIRPLPDTTIYMRVRRPSAEVEPARVRLAHHDDVALPQQLLASKRCIGATPALDDLALGTTDLAISVFPVVPFQGNTTRSIPGAVFASLACSGPTMMSWLPGQLRNAHQNLVAACSPGIRIRPGSVARRGSGAWFCAGSPGMAGKSLIGAARVGPFLLHSAAARQQ